MIEITKASDRDQGDWEDYLSRTDTTHHAYAFCWKNILSNVFGHDAYFLLARESGKVVGLCPLFHVKSMIFGQALISVPYLNAGGILADNEAAKAALSTHISELGRKLGVRYTELRHIAPSDYLAKRLPERTHKVSMVLDLPSDPETLFSSFVPKLRSQIRRPSKAGYYAQVSGVHLSVEESLNAFYRVFSEHMRDLGTPSLPKSLFSEVALKFNTAEEPNRLRVITVWKEDVPVAAGITIGTHSGAQSTQAVANGGNIFSGAPSCTEIPWASSLRKYQNDSPNMLLYWEAIKTACLDGYGGFDFGRSSPDSGTFRFKQQWGAKPVQLHWYHEVFRGSVPDVNPKSSRFEHMVRYWKRLPLPVANALGGWLSRSIP